MYHESFLSAGNLWDGIEQIVSGPGGPERFQKEVSATKPKVWESDMPTVVMKQGNACGAKGRRKVDCGTYR